jgi:DNA gyrase subunit B
LVKKIKIDLSDRRSKENQTDYTFYFENGIVAFLNYLIKDHETKSLQKNIFYVNDTYNDIEVEIALSYVDEIEVSELAFANNIHTPEGGMHLTGFRSALTRVLNDYLKKTYVKENLSLTGEDVREGLMVIVSVKIREPQFEGQTKAKLGNPEARVAVDQIMSKAFRDFLEKNPEDVKRILEKCLVSAKARSAAKLARENVLRKSVMEHTTLPGKLADCISRKAENSELFIVEGDSAGGSAKQGRDRHTQAILPLRGKILNVEKARLDRMMTSEEIKAIILALGTSISEDFNLEKLRYHKIVLMSDADVDGAHIRTLLLTLFYRYFLPIIEKGYLYAAQPPLYRVQKGKAFRYAYSDDEKDKMIEEILKIKEDKKDLKVKKEEKEEENVSEDLETEDESVDAQKYKGVIVQRYKGLGEMNPEQLWETTMDPKVRILKQITINDAKEADRLFDILMGEERMPRKKFIQVYAKKVKNLDV